MILDIIFLCLFILSIFVGYKKGMIKLLVKFIGFILAIVLAFALQNTVSNAIYESSFGKMIDKTVYEMLENKIGEVINKDNLDNVQINEISENNSVNNNEIVKAAKDFIVSNAVDSVVNEQNISIVSKSITMQFLKIISFVLIFSIVNIIAYILQMLLNLVFKMPILNGVNKIGGVLISVIIFLFKISVILAIISLVVFVADVSVLTNYINNSHIIKYMYNNNIILSLI